MSYDSRPRLNYRPPLAGHVQGVPPQAPLRGLALIRQHPESICYLMTFCFTFGLLTLFLAHRIAHGVTQCPALRFTTRIIMDPLNLVFEFGALPSLDTKKEICDLILKKNIKTLEELSVYWRKTPNLITDRSESCLLQFWWNLRDEDLHSLCLREWQCKY